MYTILMKRNVQFFLVDVLFVKTFVIRTEIYHNESTNDP